MDITGKHSANTTGDPAAIAVPVSRGPGAPKGRPKPVGSGRRPGVKNLAVQIAGHDLMKARGYDLIPVDAPDYFTDETPTAVMVRQILGAVAQFEKASLVQKLRKARERRKVAVGKCEGRKSLAELHPEAVALAKRLRRKSPKTGKRRSSGTSLSCWLRMVIETRTEPSMGAQSPARSRQSCPQHPLSILQHPTGASHVAIIDHEHYGVSTECA